MSALHEVELWAGDGNDASDRFVAPALCRQWARRDRLARLVSLGIQHPLTLITGPSRSRQKRVAGRLGAQLRQRYGVLADCRREGQRTPAILA